MINFITTQCASFLATAGRDYGPETSLPISFGPSDMAQSVSVVIASDGIYENMEGFSVVLTERDDLVQLSTDTASVHINDTDCEFHQDMIRY